MFKSLLEQLQNQLQEDRKKLDYKAKIMAEHLKKEVGYLEMYIKELENNGREAVLMTFSISGMVKIAEMATEITALQNKYDDLKELEEYSK